jgi:hypothetical protein
MRSQLALLPIGMMALGGLLGYAAAAGQFTSLWQASEAAQPGEEGSACGSTRAIPSLPVMAGA